MNSPNLYQRASLVCSKIPYGKAATYGQIALYAACRETPARWATA